MGNDKEPELWEHEGDWYVFDDNFSLCLNSQVGARRFLSIKADYDAQAARLAWLENVPREMLVHDKDCHGDESFDMNCLTCVWLSNEPNFLAYGGTQCES